MPDHQVPTVVAGELETLLTLHQFQRDSVVRKIVGVDEQQARWSPVASGTSLLWLVKHLTLAEVLWFHVRFADTGAALPANVLAPEDTIESVVSGYRAACERTDEILAEAASLDERCRNLEPDRAPEPLPLRWVLMHMLEETARHAGHADILREQIDGATGR